VKATAGDNHLGGDNWGQGDRQWLVAGTSAIRASTSPPTELLQRLSAAEKEDRALLSPGDAVNLPITAVEGQPNTSTES
jgi:hypothetical protein